MKKKENQELLKNETKKETVKKFSKVDQTSVTPIPIIYYVLLFLTVLSSLLLVTAGVKSIGLGERYSNAMQLGSKEAYQGFYYFQYERDGIFYLGLAGMALTLGLYVTTKVKDKNC